MISHPAIPDVRLQADIPSAARDWRNSYEIRKWCRQFTLISLEEQADWKNKLQYNPTVKMFGIYAEKKGPVGVCGLTSICRVNQRAEFSLYIAPGAQGQGYGSSALLLLLMHGFLDQNLNRIWGESFDGNPAQKIFEGLGMSHEGTQVEAYFREGRFVDAHLWAMTRREFNELYTDRLGHRDERPSGGGESDSGGGEHGHLDSDATLSGAPAWLRRNVEERRRFDFPKGVDILNYTGRKASSEIGGRTHSSGKGTTTSGGSAAGRTGDHQRRGG